MAIKKIDDITINEIVKYDATKDRYPLDINNSILMRVNSITSIMKERKISKSIKHIIAIPRFRRQGDNMMFYAFATNRTAYGVIRRLSKVFTEWYLETELLPLIKPIQNKFYNKPKQLPYNIVKNLRERGVKVYDHAN